MISSTLLFLAAAKDQLKAAQNSMVAMFGAPTTVGCLIGTIVMLYQHLSKPGVTGALTGFVTQTIQM
jgi:hypothetical protein